MAKEKLPRLTEAQVRALATAKVFERGGDYFSDNSREGRACMSTEPASLVGYLCTTPMGEKGQVTLPKEYRDLSGAWRSRSNTEGW